MDTIGQMFQNGMGPQAAFAAGQMLPTEQQQAQANLQSIQLANQSAAQMNPLRAQQLQAQIGQTQAQTANTQAALPGIMGQSQSQAAQGQYDVDTKATKVAMYLSNAKNQMGVDDMQQMGRDGQVASAAAQALSNYPVYMHKQVVQNIAKQYGVDPNNPLIAGILNGPDNQVQSNLAALGKGMAMASNDFMQKQGLQTQELQNRKDIATANNAKDVQVANINASARLGAAKLSVDRMKATMGVDKTIAALESQKAASGGQLPPEYEDELTRLKIQQLSAHPANGLPADMTGGKDPYQHAREAVAAQNGVNSRPAPGGNVQQMAQTAWGAYEPDKYDYRIGPNGNLQRKPK